jgi:hypothetical protein
MLRAARRGTCRLLVAARPSPHDPQEVIDEGAAAIATRLAQPFAFSHGLFMLRGMTQRTYRGTCICGGVRFEADIDLQQGTGKCNCTSCWKRRWWSVQVKPESFRSLAGAEKLSKYRPGHETGHGGFCTECGVTPYGWVEAAEWNNGAYVSVNVACLDDLDPVELVEAPVQYMDGRADNWWSPPAETRHL